MDKISIIIPFYNSQKYIVKCIECLKRQTYKNFEAIFINDASVDDGELYFKKENDSRIKLITIEKSGVSKARNVGIEHSTGEYIAFLDVDDEYKENYLEEMLKSIKNNNADIVLCNYIEHYSNYEKKVQLPWHDKIINNEEIKLDLIPAMIGKKSKNDTITNIRGLVWRTFIKREFYNKYMIKFDENVQIAEDLLFLIDLYAYAEKIYINSSYLYVYNRFNGTTLDKYIDNSITKQKYFHEKLINCLEKHDMMNENKQRYAMNRMKMYTSTISNIVRNNDKKVVNKELKELIDLYVNDNYIKDLDCNVDIMIKINQLLLKNKMVNLLKIIYTCKENKRRKKLV